MNDPCPMNLGKISNKIAMNHLHRNKMESCGDKLNNNEFFYQLTQSRDSNIFHLSILQI